MGMRKKLLWCGAVSILRAVLTLWLVFGVVENSFACREGFEAHNDCPGGTAGLTRLICEENLNNFKRILSKNENDVSLQEFGGALSDCLDTATCSSEAWIKWRDSLASHTFKTGVFSLTSAKAMNEICLFLENMLRNRDIPAYLLFRNAFNTIMHSEEYYVRNRVAPENHYVELVINYLWYSGCFDEIGAEKVIDMLNENMSKGNVTIEDFATGLCKLIMKDINKSPKDKRCIIEQGVMRFCKHIDGMLDVLESNRLTQDSIYRDSLVFVQDWWNVRSDDIKQIKNFIKTILDAYQGPDINPNIRSLPEKVLEVMRPYIMLILTGCPFAAYTDDILNKTCKDVSDEVMGRGVEELIALQERIVLDSVEDLQESLIGNKKYFHFYPRTSFNFMKESLIKRERFLRFYPLPLGYEIAPCYLLWVRHFLTDVLSRREFSKKITDLKEKNLLKPDVKLVLKKAGRSEDDFNKVTVGEMYKAV